MPRHYPAMKMNMGTWTYYTVKMNLADVASEIRFAGEVNDDATLDSAIQREINESRAKKGIVKFLSSNDDRFFSSLVVAALDGSPQFFPINVADDPRFEMFADIVQDTFGMLTFDDTIKTFALDGQHRLFAIKELIENKTELTTPPGFGQETVSVIFVVPRPDETVDSFKKSYRGLFSALNRHAKPTDNVTNIIMDEIDRFAIVTRRLVTDFDFFKWDGQGDNAKVDTVSRSESITGDKPHFITLVGLYKMNTRLLWDLEYDSEFGQHKTGLKSIVQEDIQEDEIDALSNYCENIWDALLLTLPILDNNPTSMRVMGAAGGDESQNCGLFRPIIQTNILAPLARRLMNETEKPIDSRSTAEEIKDALKPLAKIDWELSHDFWRDFLIIQDHDGNWRMANEDRTGRIGLANGILAWVVGIEDLSEHHLEDLKSRWSSYLSGTENATERETVFDDLEILREEILS